MATDTKKKPSLPNALTQNEYDKSFSEITGSLDLNKANKQEEERQYVLDQLSQTAGARIRKLALKIKADSHLREEIEKLAHELETSVPTLAKKARTEDALITQVEALVNQTEKSIVSMAKEEEAHAKKEHEKHEHKEHQIHPHPEEKPEKADKSAGETPGEKAKDKLDAIRAEIRGEKPMEANAATASLPDFTPERDKQLQDEQNAYAAGTQPITPEGIARAEELRAETKSDNAGKTDRVAEIRNETEKHKAESGLTGPHITPEGASRAEKLRLEMKDASADERKAFAQGSIQPHARANEIRKDTNELKTKHGVDAASTNADVVRAVKMEEIRKRRLKDNKIGPSSRPILSGSNNPPSLSISAQPLARKMRSQSVAGILSSTQNAYTDVTVASEATDIEYGSATLSGKIPHGPSDKNDGDTHGKTRLARDAGKYLGGGIEKGFNGGGASNVVRGGLGGGVKVGKKVAADAAKKGAAVLLRSPIFWGIVAAIIVLLFIIYLLIGDEIEKGKQAQTCAAPTETMKITVAGPTTAAAGQTLPYQITVTDTVPNQEVTVIATIPQGVSAVSTDVVSSWTRYTLTGNTITWKASENLPPNSLSPPNFNFTVTLKANAPSTNAVLVVEATPLRTTAAAPAAPGAPAVAGKEKSTAELMRIYGSTAAEVEANLVTINFQGKQVRVHKLVQGAFEKVNAEITAANTGYVFRIVGTYAWREKNCPGGCSGLSTHSFGITMDINPDTNPYTTANTHDIPPAVADAFKRNGFGWGGDWQPRHDWMHFQYNGEPGVIAPGNPGVPGAGGTNCPPAGGAVPGGPVSADYVPPSDDNCGGKYNANMSKNPTRKNFGDPQCNFTKDALHTLLKQEDPVNADFWFNTVVKCESGYNPNAYAGHAEIGTPDPGGAWGLYQMGSSTPPGSPPPAPGRGGQNDRGDVPWVIQTKNAVSKGKQLGGSQASLARYWACAR
jgi:hypothetical protein